MQAYLILKAYAVADYDVDKENYFDLMAMDSNNHCYCKNDFWLDWMLWQAAKHDHFRMKRAV